MNPCPNCGQPVPANEWASYGRHEDCAIATAPSAFPPSAGRAGTSAEPNNLPAKQAGKHYRKKVGRKAAWE